MSELTIVWLIKQPDNDIFLLNEKEGEAAIHLQSSPWISTEIYRAHEIMIPHECFN